MGENQLKPPNKSLMVIRGDMNNPWFDVNYSKVRRLLNEYGIVVDPYTIMEIVSVGREVKCRDRDPNSLMDLLNTLLSNHDFDKSSVNELTNKILKHTKCFY